MGAVVDTEIQPVPPAIRGLLRRAQERFDMILCRLDGFQCGTIRERAGGWQKGEKE